MPKSLRIPSYRNHKPTGRAVVTIDGRDFYLGKHNTAASRAEYNRIIAEWLASGCTLAEQQSDDLTVAELCAAFMRHATKYYRGPDGKQTTEVANYKPALRRLKAIYARTRVADFGPLALKAVRQKMIEDGLARETINKGINRIRRMFKWGVENQLVGANVLHGLQAVAGLRRGRSDARETAPVKPVPDVFVDAVIDHVSTQVGAMIELQRVTGMRSGEVCQMRTADIDMKGKVWVYRPETHKTAWHGHDRNIYLGPKAQKIIRPFLKTDLHAHLFSPAEAEAERNERRFGVFSPDRKTKVFPSEILARAARREQRRKRRTKRQLRKRYTTDTYLRAVVYGIEAANRARLAEAQANGIDLAKVKLVPHWHPHQLRHNAATNLRREFGIEVARIILGHRSPAITEVYAEVDHARAIDVMAEVG